MNLLWIKSAELEGIAYFLYEYNYKGINMQNLWM